MLEELFQPAHLCGRYAHRAEPLHPRRPGPGREAALELRDQGKSALALVRRGRRRLWVGRPRVLDSDHGRRRHPLVVIEAGQNEEPIRRGVRPVVGLELVVSAAGLRGGRAAVRLNRDEPLRLDGECSAQQRYLEAARAVAPAPEQAGEHRNRRQQSRREVGHRDPAGTLGNAIGVPRPRHQQSRKRLRDEIECGQRSPPDRRFRARRRSTTPRPD